jgi:hypothetical protein
VRFLQLGIGQKALGGGVFTFEVLEMFGVLGLHRRGVLAFGQQPNGRHQLAAVSPAWWF